MIRRSILILVVLLIPVAAFAANPEHGGAPEKFLGLPFWFWKPLNMIAFFAILYLALKKPIANALKGRSEALSREAQEAQERRAKADQMAKDIEARLGQIESEVKSIRDRAAAEGERQKRELIAAGEAEAAKILQAARAEIDSRLKVAKHELTEYAGELATERAEAILRDKITEEDRKKLFQESLREVSST